MKTRRQASYDYYGLGFLVRLINCPVVQCEGEWVPRIDFNRLASDLALMVPLKPAPLTGHELKFLRRHYGWTLDQMAERLQVTRQAIMKWEKKGDEAANLEGPSNIALRLLFLTRAGVDPHLFKKAADQIWTHRQVDTFAFRHRADRRQTPRQLLAAMSA